MAQNLLEQYSKRLAVAESVYSEAHNGKKMDNFKKLCTARCLANVDTFLTEAFENSVGTQRAQLGQYKQFALNLTNVVLPNLIAPEIVIVHPMSSFTGYVTYQKKVA